jgi:SAM-dependent methyltransferase
VRPVPPTGHWHDDYERGRPGWPSPVAAIADVPTSGTVVELGAGTGKLTRLLLERFRGVIAVEPDEEMRRVLVSMCPDAEVTAGSAEAIPLADRSVDAAFAAEAFHWFDGERALAEIERVLQPGGALILMWNVPAGPTEPSIASAERLLMERAPATEQLGHDPVDLNTTRFASGEWRAPFAGSRFDELTVVGDARLLDAAARLTPGLKRPPRGADRDNANRIRRERPISGVPLRRPGSREGAGSMSPPPAPTH